MVPRLPWMANMKSEKVIWRKIIHGSVVEHRNFKDLPRFLLFSNASFVHLPESDLYGMISDCKKQLRIS